MDGWVPSVTADGDSVVEMSGVCKTFRQRQRSEKLADVFRGLLKPEYREVRALQEIDLTIRGGEIVAYAGANGAGKSTSIKLLCGMLWPDAGRICVLGMDPARERTRYVGRIGVVFGQRTDSGADHPVAASFEWKRVVWDIPRDRYDRMLGTVKGLLGLNEFFRARRANSASVSACAPIWGWPCSTSPKSCFLTSRLLAWMCSPDAICCASSRRSTGRTGSP